MLTELGKYLRTLRLEKGLKLKDMATSIDYTPAFLSAIELGRKAPPADFATKIGNAFGVSAEAKQYLKQLCSIKSVKITPHTLDQNFILESLARRMDSLSFDEITEIKTILGGNDK